jgi:hypothetical protein
MVYKRQRKWWRSIIHVAVFILKRAYFKSETRMLRSVERELRTDRKLGDFIQIWCIKTRKTLPSDGYLRMVVCEIVPVHNQLSNMPWRRMGEWRYRSTILHLGNGWVWVVSLTPRPLYCRGKSPRYPLDRRLGVTQSRSVCCGEGIIR